ncbi:hypothetical protein AB0N05_12735 [Nocardia sp. NPDC051030]|uniref:hypothetical protein n=1 Tax=Nocardia sp. NPDC051030 TaxID=3155162 RepID=UPI0034162191
MTEPDREDASLIAAPRSSLWRGLLGTASAVATALIYELARNLIVNSLGEDAHVKAVVETVLWAPVAVLGVVAAGYVVYRLAHGWREQRYAARESDLMSTLAEPGPLITPDTGVRVAVSQSGAPGRVDDDTLVAATAVIDALPISAYRTAALLYMLAAMVDAPHRRPDVEDPPNDRAGQLLAALLGERITLLTADRCERRDPPAGSTPPVLDASGPMWPAALPALLRYHADLAERWALALGRTAAAAAARRWFAAEAPYLHGLVIDCVTRRLEPPMRMLHRAIIPDLARLCDALDAWYAIVGRDEDTARPGDSIGVAQAMRMLTQLGDNISDPLDATPTGASEPGLRPYWQLARIRTGEAAVAPGGIRHRRLRFRRQQRQLETSLHARAVHRMALLRFAGLRSADPAPIRTAALTSVEQDLERAWRRLPRPDITGEVSALVNLAVVHLHQGRLDAAADRLELAETLTRADHDPYGRAHTHEISGAVWWARGEPAQAIRCWQFALRDYRSLNDTLGIARNLQHLGAAAVVAPEYGGLLLTDSSPATTVEVLRQAIGWLDKAITLSTSANDRHRAEGSTPVIRYALEYREKARQALHGAPGPLNPPGEPQDWPLPDA